MIVQRCVIVDLPDVLTDGGKLLMDMHKRGLLFELMVAIGPGGGNPMCRVSGPKANLESWFTEVYCEDESIEEYLEWLEYDPPMTREQFMDVCSSRDEIGEKTMKALQAMIENGEDKVAGHVIDERKNVSFGDGMERDYVADGDAYFGRPIESMSIYDLVHELLDNGWFGDYEYEDEL